MDQTSRLDGITYCCPQSQQDIAIRNQVGENFISSGMICGFIIVSENEEGGALFDCCRASHTKDEIEKYNYRVTGQKMPLRCFKRKNCHTRLSLFFVFKMWSCIVVTIFIYFK